MVAVWSGCHVVCDSWKLNPGSLSFSVVKQSVNAAKIYLITRQFTSTVQLFCMCECCWKIMIISVSINT